MKRFSLTGLLLMAAVLCFLVGCGDPALPPSDSDTPALSTPEVSPVLPFTLPFYPDYSLHPALAENRANMALSSLLYEGLFALDDTFTPKPVLCQSHSVSEDGLTWTFVLRQGVTFSDGTPLTGELAAQALNTALGTGSRFAGRISGLRSITGSQTTVTVSLTSPNGALPTLLDIPISKDAGTRPAGTGPYQLTQSGNQYALTARPDWWQGQDGRFDTIQLFAIQQADDLIAAFDSGDVTMLEADLTGTNALGYSGSYEVWDYNTSDFLYLGFNTAKGYCQNAATRQAISRGIDRNSITTIPYARHALAAPLPIHPDSPLHDQALADQAGYAPEVLVEFLKTNAAPKAPLKLLVNSENSAKVAAADYIAYQLQAAGLPVTVQKLSWDSFLAALRVGNFDFYLGEVRLTADFDLTALLSSHGSLNYSRWKDGQTDQLLAALRAAGGDARPAAAQALYQYLFQQSPITPVCFKYGCVLTQWGRLTGLDPRQGDLFYGLNEWTLDP